MGILIKEHIAYTLTLSEDPVYVALNKQEALLRTPDIKVIPRIFKTERGRDYSCFHCHTSEKQIELYSGYFVGIDWLTQDRYIHIEPKLNTEIAASFDLVSNSEEVSDQTEEALSNEAKERIKKSTSYKEVDVIAVLMELMSHPEAAKHTNNLLLIDWEMPEISITQKQDLLTPFLVVRFLKLLQDIVKKGLKKSYYKVEENLRNKIKGKILVGQQIKQNIFKNRFTNTVCEYQIFGEDSIENRFLKKVFVFCTQYIENNTPYFKNQNNIAWLINYIRPALEHISTDVDIWDIKHLKYNPFFKEYKDAIKVGQHILKRFSYNITRATTELASTPPFWIDMPRMFELYCYVQLLKANPEAGQQIKYQFSTYGNALDILIAKPDSEMIIDAKYKLHYRTGKVHQDIRQVSGYARLQKVRSELKIEDDRNIDCLIIYPDMENGIEDLNSFNLESIKALLDNPRNQITAYHKVFKLGLKLPHK